MTCSILPSVPTQVRAEGVTEHLGDIVLACIGGIPTPAGQPIPLANIRVASSVPLTNRVFADGTSDALLLIDEPFPGSPFPSGETGILGNSGPQVFCVANGGATNGVGNCELTGTGGATNPYQGTKNVFQGIVTELPGVVYLDFLGVPIDPPAPDYERVIRITNLRGDVTPVLQSQPVTVTVSFSGDAALVLSIPSVTAAFAYSGLAAAPNCTYDQVGHFVSCPGSSTHINIGASEGFASSFRTAVVTGNDQGGSGGLNSARTMVGGMIEPQNLVGVAYNTESALTISATPSSYTGSGIGEASHGTWLMVTLTNIPAGVQITAPGSVAGDSGSPNLLLYRVDIPVGGWQFNPAFYASAPANELVVDTTVANPPTSADIVYEVVADDPTLVESFNIPLSVSAQAGVSTTGITTALMFAPVPDAPVYTGAESVWQLPSTSYDIPRFLGGPALGTNALLFGSAAGTSSVVLTDATVWTATANDSFLHISPGSASGTGNALVVFTYDAFTGTGMRTGTLTIAGLTVTVTQAGTNYIGPGPVITLVSSGLSYPNGVAVDGSGNVYIADYYDNAIKEWVASTQQLTTLVSSGLVYPTDVAVDGSGNVYIADMGHSAIKEWSVSTQQVSTLVSSGLSSHTYGVAVDGFGNVYITDCGNNAISEWIASTQQVTTLVSSGLNCPVVAAVDASGNLYISDEGNQAIKEWSASTQQVTTLVSSGLSNPAGTAVDGSGNVYIADAYVDIADSHNEGIKEWSASTGQVTTLVSSGLNFPWGVAVDGSGNVYFADTNNWAIKEIPYAFVGPASLSEPASAGTDSLLPVLPSTTSLTGIFAPVSDQNWLTIGTVANGVISFSFTANTSSSNRVAHITVLGQQNTVTQNGLTQTTQIITFGPLPNQALGAAPFTVSATASSGLPVSFSSQTVSVCTVSGSQVTLVALGTCTIQATQAGNNTYAAATPVNQSFQVTVVRLNISSLSPASAALGGAAFTLTVNGTGFVSGAVVMWNSTALSTSSVSSTQLTAAVPAALIASAGTATVTVVNPGGGASGGVGFPVYGLGANALLFGSAAGTSSVVLTYPGAWTATANNSFLHISPASASGTGSAVVVFSYDAFAGTGTRTGTLTIAGLTVTVTQAGTNYIGPGPLITLVSGLNGPDGVAVDGLGNVYIANTNGNEVREWSASTQEATTLVGLYGPDGVAVDGSGNVYIADGTNDAITEWSAATKQVTTLVSSGLTFPTGVAVDGGGNVYIADAQGSAVKEWSVSTQQVTTLASSGLDFSYGVAVDGSGNVYIADANNDAIKEWSASTQQVTTLVSSGLSSPTGVAVDGSGNVYIADAHNQAIKEWSASTEQVATLSSGLANPLGVAVDGSGNVYFSDYSNSTIMEIPYAFVGPASLTEPASAGTDSLLPVLPATTPLTGIFAPTSDQSWLTIGTVANGVISFSFAANTSTSAQVAHITVLGQQITVTQNGTQKGTTAQIITFGTLANQPLGAAPFTVSATASSGLPVSFNSQTTSVCTVSGSQVTLVAGGTCTVQATQAGNATYAPAPSVSQSFQVTPDISSLNPASAAQGGAAFTLTVNGVGFVSGAVVMWNSTALPTSFVSSTELTASVPSTLIGLAGAATVTVVNPGGGFSGGVGFPIYGLGANTLLFGSAAGTSSVVLTYTGAWTASANDSFLHISPGSASGTGSAVVAFTYDAFTGTGTRTGTLTIGGLTVTVTQAGTDYIGPGPMITLVSGPIYENVAVDGSGNVYFPVSFNSGLTATINEWSASTQQVTTLVSWPYTVDGVAVDVSGNVYFVSVPEFAESAIGEWSPSTQQVATLVGGSPGQGVAVDGSGNVYFTSHDYYGVSEWTASTHLLTGLVSGLWEPQGVAVDASGNLYFAELGGPNEPNTIEEWSAFTQQLTALVMAPGLADASGVAVDGSGNVYFADIVNQAIKEWSASTQQVTTFVPFLFGASGVAVDGSGNVYMVDSGTAIDEVPHAFVGPASLSEPFSAGSDSLQVLPATQSLTGVFAPSSDQSWLTIRTAGNGVVNFSFAANGSTSAQVAHITVLGMQITVTQAGMPAQTIAFGSLSNQPIGTAPFTVSATASSGLPVSFNSQTTSVCTVSGSQVTLIAVGTCTIQATQAGSSSYAAATPVSQSFQVTVVTPTISSLSPASAAPGGTAFTLTVNGADFLSGAVMMWNSTALPTSFVSSTELTVSVPAALIASAGTATVTVVNPGGGASSGAAFPIGPGLGANTLLVGSAAGSSSVVLSDAGAWTATANDSFLHISAGSATGTGSAVVVFTYDAFTGTGIRTGTLTIAGLTVTVTQAGTNYMGPGPVLTLVSLGLYPSGVAVDGSGNVYIADRGDNTIMEWSASTQQVTTLVSSGLSEPFGVAVDGSGNVYIADSANNAIKEWSASTQQVTTMVSSGLYFPEEAAVDRAGNLYIADTYNNAIKEWSASTQQVTTMVSSGLHSPSSVAVDVSGNVYIADAQNSAIREWSASTQQVTTLVSSGLAVPGGVAMDGSGNVYIADTSDNAIKEWTPSTQQVTTLVSSGLVFPWGVAVDGSGSVYIADTYNSALKKIPYVFVGPASLTEPASAGMDSLLPVLPATTSLAGIFAPTSDQRWLTIGTVANGVISFSFTANTSTSAQVAHITVLGQQITVTQNGLAGQTAQTITFGPLPSQTFGTAPFTVSATASSGLPVSFNSQTTSVCTVSGSQVTLIAVGTCTIHATQAGNSTYAAATPVNQSFQVTAESQTITFGTLSNQVLGSAPFTVSATSASGLPVSFASTTPLVCTVSGATVTLVAAGKCTIEATQAGNTTYAAATPVDESFWVTPTPLSFVPMTPCRIADTRYSSYGSLGPPSLVGGAARSFAIPSSGCNIPTTAAAYSLNVTVVPPGPLDYMTVWPSGAAQPLVSTLNSVDGRIKANAAIIPAGTGGAVSVYATNTTDLILDIDGYFVPAGSDASALAFYPLTPCRVADTRYSSYGSLGQPSLSAGQARSFDVLSSTCGVPSTAQAYSLNFTVAPHGKAPVNYITTYPSGATQPLASTLNDMTGTVTANAAIVPAGSNGAVSVYSYSPTDLLIDINGYFAPPGTGGLSLYNLTPYRVLDSRQPAPSTPFTGEKDVNVMGSGCGASSTAQAYVFNATVAPPGPMNYLTLWPQGGTMPVVSTLNAMDGAITSNMALVPTTNGSISSYVYIPSTTYLILDIFGYFAP
jgi:sugar lactone lactonase YvrE